MPIPPPAPSPPYDYLESVLQVARTRVNDAIASINGDILTDTQPFTATMTNSAWRKLQAYLANLGYSRLKQQFIAPAFPIVANLDPASQTFWSWIWYFDGTSYYAPPNINVLPFDLIVPLRMWERPTGSNSYFQPMCMAPDGLPDCRKTCWNRYFEWREDAIYMPGSLASMDFRIEYAAYLPDFAVTSNILGNPAIMGPDGNPLTPANMVVPIMRCQSSLANYLAAELCMGRDDVDVQSFITSAEMDARLVMNNEVKLKQRTPVSRKPYGGFGNGSSWRLNGYQGY